MKKLINLMILATMLLGASLVYAQQVQQQGKNFTEVSTSKSKGKETKTEYTYSTSKGVTYPVYLSSTGKAFIKKVSKKTRKKYKQYRAKVGKVINPRAYKEK